jgi:hypothetical protein
VLGVLNFDKRVLKNVKIEKYFQNLEEEEEEEKERKA